METEENNQIKENQRLWKCPPLHTQFPIRFKKSTFIWTNITGYCNQCNQPIEKQRLHGEVNEPFQDIFNIKAIGYCKQCKKLTIFNWNLKPNEISGRDKEGNWATHKTQKAGKIKSLFKKALSIISGK